MGPDPSIKRVFFYGVVFYATAVGLFGIPELAAFVLLLLALAGMLAVEN